MASRATSVRVPALPAERFFQGSLLLFVGSSIATLIATGKLDPLSCVVATLAMTYKGFRWWRRKPIELSHRTATVLVVSHSTSFSSLARSSRPRQTPRFLRRCWARCIFCCS
jgi:hypothetical protein